MGFDLRESNVSSDDARVSRSIFEADWISAGASAKIQYCQENDVDHVSPYDAQD